jgi:hypothetical protein
VSDEVELIGIDRHERPTAVQPNNESPVAPVDTTGLAAVATGLTSSVCFGGRIAVTWLALF